MVLPVHSQTNSPPIACDLLVQRIGFQPLDFSLDWALGFLPEGSSGT